MTNNILIKTTNISKKYGDTSVLEDINLEIKTGEDLLILGPSGSGKTTLLQIIGGLLQQSSGSVEILGKKIENMTDNELSTFRNETIGFVFQNNYLQDYLTAKENVMIPLLIKGIDRKTAEKKAIELLQKVGMSHRTDHIPSKLSGGEEQRIAIARALANNPKLILADEPTAKLDKANRDNILELLKELNTEGISIVCITHDEKYTEIFTQVLRIEDGKIKQKNKKI